MITSKQRSFLRSLAHNIDPTVYIGKAGVTGNVIKEIDQCLEARELVKVKIQEGAELDAKATANELAKPRTIRFTSLYFLASVTSSVSSLPKSPR